MNVINLVDRIRRSQETAAARQLGKFEPLVAEFALSFADLESRLPGSEDIDKDDLAVMIGRGLLGIDFVGHAEFHVLYWRAFLAWMMARDPAALDEMLRPGGSVHAETQAP